MPSSRTILLVDDSEDDRILLRRAFQKAGVINPVQEVVSGDAAIAYLNGDGPYQDRQKYPFPGILLLDLNMPGKDGFEVLAWVRNKLTVGGLLIIVLSRLDEMRNINRAYALGANSFLTKPGDLMELEGLINSFREYWLTRNKPPTSLPTNGS
jgi:CheY-like chemotaxis protein